MRNLTLAEYLDLSDSLFQYHYDLQGKFDPARARAGCFYHFYLLNTTAEEAKSMMEFEDDVTPELTEAFVAAMNDPAPGLTFANAYQDAVSRAEWTNDGQRQLSEVLMAVTGLIGMAAKADMEEEPGVLQ